MEHSSAESQPRRGILRGFRFSLTTLVVGCLLAGAVINLYLSQIELRELKEKNTTLVTQLRWSEKLISLEINHRPLKQVLDYLSDTSGVSIRTRDRDEALYLSFKLENMTYREILAFIAKKYGMTVDDSAIADKIIYIGPSKEIVEFKDADIRDVFHKFAAQYDVNLLMAPEVQGHVTLSVENGDWRTMFKTLAKALDFEVKISEFDSAIGTETVRIWKPASRSFAP